MTSSDLEPGKKIALHSSSLETSYTGFLDVKDDDLMDISSTEDFRDEGLLLSPGPSFYEDQTQEPGNSVEAGPLSTAILDDPFADAGVNNITNSNIGESRPPLFLSAFSRPHIFGKDDEIDENAPSATPEGSPFVGLTTNLLSEATSVPPNMKLYSPEDRNLFSKPWYLTSTISRKELPPVFLHKHAVTPEDDQIDQLIEELSFHRSENKLIETTRNWVDGSERASETLSPDPETIFPEQVVENEEIIPGVIGSTRVHQPGEAACWIAAEHASRHARDSLPQVDEVFSKWQIPESEYAIQAGFDESLIQNGVGHLEQIHVFLASNHFDHNSSPFLGLLSDLGKIFSPFSSVLFTQSSSHRIPIYDGDGRIWDFDEHVQETSSKFIDAGASGALPPIAIALSYTAHQQSEALSGFSSQDSDKQGGEEGEETGPEKGKGRDDEQEDEANNNGDDSEPEPEPNPPVGGGSKITEPCTVYFTVHSKIYKQNSSGVFQSLKSDGALTIQTTLDPDVFAKCKIKFTTLNFGSQQTTAEKGYKQFHARVVIDSHRPAARVVTCKPRRTLEYAEDWKETSAQMVNRTAAAEFSMTPKATLTLARQTSAATEKMKHTSEVSQQDEQGVIWWGFNVNDPKAQREGVEMVETNLPEVEFELRGNAEGRTLPDDIELEVLSYWSTISGNSGTKRLLKSSARDVSYSNLCQIVALKIPSDQRERSDYVATLPIYLGQQNPIALPIYEAGSAQVTPAVKWGVDMSTINRDWTEHTTLRFPSLKVAVLPPMVEKATRASQSTWFSSFLSPLVEKMQRIQIEKIEK